MSSIRGTSTIVKVSRHSFIVFFYVMFQIKNVLSLICDFFEFKRCASSAAQAQTSAAPKAVRPAEAVRVSTSSNGLKVATLENHGPVSRVAAVVKTGARDEAGNQLGAAHALRVFSSLVGVETIKKNNII